MPSFPCKTSFWFDPDHVTAEAAVTRPQETDVIIVGGGFAGLSAAYHLTQQDASQRIILLDAHHIGYGASGRAAGWLMNLPPALWLLDNLNDPKILDDIQFVMKLCEANIRQIGKLVSDAQIDCDWTETEHALVARNRVEEATLQWVATRFEVAGLESTLHDRWQTSRLVGYGGRSALTFKMRTIQPYLLARGVADWLLQRGVVIYEGTRAKQIVDLPEGVRVVTEDDVAIRARHVIVATNAYTGDLAIGSEKLAGRTNHTYIVATEPLEGDMLARISPTQTPFGDPSIAYFIGRIVQGRLLFNGIDRRSQNTLADDRHMPSYLRLYAEMIRRFPFLKGVTVESAWGGAVQETRTEAPVVRHAANNRHVILNLGYGGGSGIGLALLSGRITTALILGEESQDADAIRLQTLYANSRFPVTGPLRAAAGVMRHLFIGQPLTGVVG